ncbi:hypothetical protein [Saccharomonospora xinjiangensis]|nr:hypothetical protein [Saccharomonospora xinjiangensis]
MASRFASAVLDKGQGAAKPRLARLDGRWGSDPDGSVARVKALVAAC